MTHVVGEAARLDPPLIPEITENVYGSWEDIRLLEEFRPWLAGVSFKDFVQPPKGHKPPRDLSDYSLTSLVYDEPGVGTDMMAGYSFTWPEGVRRTADVEVYLDTSIGIGMTYKGRLVGVAAAALVAGSVLRIEQLQGVAGRCTTDEERRESGLYGGFHWRDTLVNAWAGFARHRDIRVLGILGAANNMWLTEDFHGKPPITEDMLRTSYDHVAQRMGFAQEHDGNWYVKL